MPPPALITHLPINRFPDKLSLVEPNNSHTNPVFCLFFFILNYFIKTLFINKPDSLKDLAIFMILFISSLEIINVVIADLNIFWWIAASVAAAAAAAAVNPNRIKTLQANVLS